MTTREPVPLDTVEYLNSLEMRNETTLTFLPIHPEMFSQLKHEADTITQLYLSHPGESYRLKLEETVASDGHTGYTATLEDFNTPQDDTDTLPLIETEITKEAFDFYSQQSRYSSHQKQRYQVSPGVAVDWLGAGDPVLKIDKTAHVPDMIQLTPDLYEFTDSPLLNDEARAHAANQEVFLPPEIPSPLTIARSISEHQASNPYTVITITGRSGSGKSTIKQDIIDELAFLSTEPLSIVELSTDNYHRGLTWLTAYNRTVNQSNKPWDDWDTRIVYDIDAARGEISELLKGAEAKPIRKRAYDFSAQEPAKLTELVEPGSIIILEGLHAGDRVFEDVAHIRYEMPTDIATSIGRRLQRDFTTGRATGDNVSSPDKLLRYMVERAEPAYQTQER